MVQRRRLIVAISMVVLLSGLVAPPGYGITSSECSHTNSHLLIDTDAETTILDPATTREVVAPWSPDRAALLLSGASWRDAFETDDWVVTRSSSASAYHIEVGQRATGEPIVAMDFDRRIELATSVISPSSRFTVFIQANNLASELTLIDAATASVRSLTIPHQAPLAAFSIDGAFSSDETCLAVSMERSGGPGPETWLIDLETGEVGTARPGAVIGWW